MSVRPALRWTHERCGKSSGGGSDGAHSDDGEVMASRHRGGWAHAQHGPDCLTMRLVAARCMLSLLIIALSWGARSSRLTIPGGLCHKVLAVHYVTRHRSSPPLKVGPATLRPRRSRRGVPIRVGWGHCVPWVSDHTRTLLGCGILGGI